MKQDRYHIKIDPPQPDSEQIRKHQDFEALLAAHAAQQEPTRRPIRRIILYASVAAALLLAIGWVVTQGWTGPDQQMAERPFIDEPLVNVKPRFASYTFDAYQGGVYEHESGSRLIIPGQAFVNAQGMLVAGKVQMRYREMHDFVDFFLSGIPMQYDSSGTRYWLESSGMIEVYVEQNGEALQLDQGKRLEIELVSSLQTDGGTNGFNIYKLDTDNKQWVYKGPDKLTVLASTKPEEIRVPDEVLRLQKNLKLLEKQLYNFEGYKANQLDQIRAQANYPGKPKAPRKADPENFVFDLDINEERFPELASYQTVKWEVIDHPQNTGFSAEIYEVDWIDAQLVNRENDLVELILLSENQEVRVLVEPVLSGNDLAKARRKYEAELSSWEQETVRIDQSLQPLIEAKAKELDSEAAALNEEVTQLEKQINAALAGLGKGGQPFVPTHQVLNQFSVNSLGIWNCDRPVEPKGLLANAKFVNQEGQQYLESPVYLADPFRNTINKFDHQSAEQFQTDRSQSQLVWLVTPEGRIAITRASESSTDDSGELEFVMKEIDKKVQNESDLRQILKFN
ncbi:MAG: hypothetical protein AAF598_02995 [Bacteroidota bacterium]